MSLPSWLVVEHDGPVPYDIADDPHALPLMREALWRVHETFPDLKIRVRFSRDPETGGRSFVLRIVAEANTRELRDRAADLAIEMNDKEGSEKVEIVIGVETGYGSDGR